MPRIAVDPVTRVNGQLRVEADVEAGRVADAWTSGTTFRGLETALRGRDPRDAWLLAERICGSCSGVHALASVRAVERALRIQVPANARLVRNVLAASLLVRDHVLGFYQAQGPDWVDARAALTADPAATSRLAHGQGSWPASGVDHFREVRDRIGAVIRSGQPGPLASGWSGHPEYRLSPEQSLLLLSHLLDALDWQRGLMRLQALFGGKDPHPQAFLVGGMALAPPWGGPAASRARQHPPVPDRNAPIALGDPGLRLADSILNEARTFVDQVFLPDVRMLAGAYPDWSGIGRGTGSFLAFGDYPLGDDPEPSLFLPAGRMEAASLLQADPVDQEKVAEAISRAWYEYSNGHLALRRPFEGETNPSYGGPPVPFDSLEGAGRYSWVKGARYQGRPFEVGPLARVLAGVANGRSEVRSALERLLAGMDRSMDAMEGVIGRVLARAVEAQVMVRRADAWLWELRSNLSTGDVALANVELWDPVTWPAEAEGWSTGEGPRGAVGHWLTIRDGVIDRYQVVDASTWNASPRDGMDQRGPIEEALVDVPVADLDRPLELLRVVRSFAPCAACATHAHGGGGALDVAVRRREGTR